MLSLKEYVNEQSENKEFKHALDEARAELAFGVALCQRREDLGLTQKVLAEMTGIRQPMIARIESGQLPKPLTIQKLAKALKVKIVFAGDHVYVKPIRPQGAEAPKSDALVSALFDVAFAKELESEIPISNVINIEEFREKRKPLTVGGIEIIEGNYESVKSFAGKLRN